MVRQRLVPGQPQILGFLLMMILSPLRNVHRGSVGKEQTMPAAQVNLTTPPARRASVVNFAWQTMGQVAIHRIPRDANFSALRPVGVCRLGV